MVSPRRKVCLCLGLWIIGVFGLWVIGLLETNRKEKKFTVKSREALIPKCYSNILIPSATLKREKLSIHIQKIKNGPSFLKAQVYIKT
jgi:hypothetical protein